MADELELILQETDHEIAQLGPEHAARAHARAERLRLAGEILEARIEKGWTQAQLAKAADIKQPELSKIECAVSNPTADTLARVLRALGRHLTTEPIKEVAQSASPMLAL